jgi:tol-pal system protein YbgF
MKTTMGFGILLPVLALLVGGCMTNKDLAPLQQDIQSVRKKAQGLDERVRMLEQQIRGVRGGDGREVPTLADMNARLEKLQVEVGRIKGHLEERERRQGVSSGGPLPSQPSYGPSSPSRPSPSQQPSSSVESPPGLTSQQNAYEKGLQLFQKGRYSEARQSFQQYIAANPDSNLADNGLYWIGECYFEEQRYSEAIDAYQRLLDQYPQGNKAPYGMLRQGDAFERLGDQTAARILYKRIVSKYPNTPQAQIAQRKLEQL